MKILVMTGTIKPLCGIKYNDVRTRLQEYIRNIERYITRSNFDAIIFAENSEYKFMPGEYENLAREYGKEFEYLNLYSEDMNGDMSVGDAKIIQRSIKESKIIGKSQCKTIWKVSGRIWIRNINQIIEESEVGNVFLAAPKYNSIQTWFLSSNIDDLNHYFFSEEAMEDIKNTCIEYAFKNMYEKYKSKIQIFRFSSYPDAEGINSSGVPYTQLKWRLVLKNILLKIGYFTVK